MDAKLINATTDLVSLVPGLRRSGQYHIGPCPFCGGEDRFTIKRTDAGDLWLCRKCGDGKYHDAVAFRMRAEGQSFRQVVSGDRRGGAEEQGSRGAGEAPFPPFSLSPSLPFSPAARPAPDLIPPPDEEWQIARLEDQKRLADNLWLRPDEEAAAPQPLSPELTAVVWHYLRAYRGLSPDTIRRFMIGFNPEGATLPDGSVFPPGLHIPCMVAGQLWYVKARLPKWALAEAQQHGRRLPKYMMLRGSRTALFNADALLGARVAVVVEGEFDALLLGQFLPEGWAAVTMGGAGLLPDERFLPYFSGVERALLALDGDGAGRKGLAAWRKLLGWAEAAAPLPPGAKDLTEFWRMKGDINEWINSCMRKEK